MAGKSTIKRWMGGVAALPVFIAGPALAATPVYNWTGFYIGVNAGGAWGSFGSDTVVDCNVPNSPPAYICGANFPGDAALVNWAGTGTVNANGFTGGVQAGYNWQTGNIVAGIESDFGAFHLRGTRQGDGVFVNTWFGTPFTVTTSASTDWLYTFRGRLGFTATPNLMGYVTGGLAVTRIGTGTVYADDNSYFIGPVSGSYGATAVKAGYTVGIGAEYALGNNWTVKAEYLYLNFGSVLSNGIIQDFRGQGYFQGLSTRTDLTANIARLGVNRKF